MASGARYLELPFLGAAIGKKRRRNSASEQPHDAKGNALPKKKRSFRPRGPHEKNGTGNGSSGHTSNLGLGLTKTAADVAQMSEEDIIMDYNAPIHMWVVTTLFPLIAGTFGPIASMFNVCAIATDWRIVVSPASGEYPMPNSTHSVMTNMGSTCSMICTTSLFHLNQFQMEAGGRYITDPPWLIAVNVVSLAIALVANLLLLGQMTSRIRYNISGPITIIGFFISGLVDIVLVAVASQVLPLDNHRQETYSQAFYYACFSGAIYVVLAMLLSMTAWGIWFGHYSEEFKLSLSQRSLMLQTMLFLTYVLAAGAVYSDIEGWDYNDSTYWVMVTVFTIGFGDYSPSTHLGRSLFFPFAIGGIVFVGVIIANIRTVILESASVKVSTRLVEKARFKVIQQGEPEMGIFKVHTLLGTRIHDTKADKELARRQKEFQLMRAIQRQAHLQNRLISLGFAMTAFLTLWFVGGLVFWQSEILSVGGENWSYFESMYFTFVAQLTIGYGDFAPQTNSAKPAFVLWALISLPTLTVLIGSVGDAVSSLVNWYTTWIGEHATALYDIFVALYQPNNRARDKIRDLIKDPNKKKDEEDQDADRGIHNIGDVEIAKVLAPDFATQPFSTWQIDKLEDKYRPYIAIKAMQKIVDSLEDEPPKKYNYKEWTWLLKLIGEDETTEDGHRYVGRPLPEGMEVAEPVRENERQMWSWLGQESPLMNLAHGSEAKWMIRKLMEMLEQELKERADRHVERDMGVAARMKVHKAIQNDEPASEPGEV